MTSSTNEYGTYQLLQSLGKYLNTDVGITCGKISSVVSRGTEHPTVDRDGYSITATISNTAPKEPSYPLIVFMGVGLKIQFPNTSHRTITRMHNENNLKVDKSNADKDPFSVKESVRIDSPEYPHLTSDEQKHGHILFPNQSIIYDMSLTAKECPNINEIKLWAEGTISRRHLFHQSKQITIAGENIVYQL